MTSLDLVKLAPLMKITSGHPAIKVALIDGPIVMDHPDIVASNIEAVSQVGAACSSTSSVACSHGTFVAGMLMARRGSVAPAICPGCTLLVRPIFTEETTNGMPSAKPEELASAIAETIDAGARVINLSAALAQPSIKGRQALQDSLDYAARRGVIVVAAAGNQAIVGSTTITQHPWILPVAGCDLRGQPVSESNMGLSIGRNGLMAPARDITSLGSNGKPQTSGGTSAAAPFVTGAIALLLAEFPNAAGPAVKTAVSGSRRTRRTVVPPLLDAWSAYQNLAALHGRLAS
jgi:subtilisin family serine protease